MFLAFFLSGRVAGFSISFHISYILAFVSLIAYLYYHHHSVPTSSIIIYLQHIQQHIACTIFFAFVLQVLSHTLLGMPHHCFDGNL
ncbi:hypothetical protein CPC08DRAFT_443666 [Agrocybe pediades]|nr:hypothetical protein CPC08DRAFT_443666 [Agrocybe pediades]